MTFNPSNKHEIRLKTKELLINDLELGDIEATDLEIGIFNSTIDYANSLRIPLSWSNQLLIDTYLNIARSIYSNLKKDSYIKNDKLLDKIKTREILPHNLPYMTVEEIFPEKWNNIIEKQKLKFKEAYEIKQVSMSEVVRCGRCKNYKVTFYELQTRSADEPATTFYTCLYCGNKWKN